MKISLGRVVASWAEGFSRHQSRRKLRDSLTGLMGSLRTVLRGGCLHLASGRRLGGGARRTQAGRHYPGGERHALPRGHSRGGTQGKFGNTFNSTPLAPVTFRHAKLHEIEQLIFSV